MRRRMFDIFKQPLTHISSIPEGCVERLLVMLEQVLDVGEAFDLEDLRFFLDHLPGRESRVIQTQRHPRHRPRSVSSLTRFTVKLLKKK